MASTPLPVIGTFTVANRPNVASGFLALHARADVHAAVFVSYLEA